MYAQKKLRAILKSSAVQRQKEHLANLAGAMFLFERVNFCYTLGVGQNLKGDTYE